MSNCIQLHYSKHVGTFIFMIWQSRQIIKPLPTCCLVYRSYNGCHNIIYVTGSEKRYTNAQAMIFLYKRCCSKTVISFIH